MSGIRQRMADELTAIVPTFRCAQYLPAAIASVLHTGVGQLIVTDDASGDDTVAVAKQWEARFPDRVKVLESTVNRGTASNVNHAACFVKTPYFAKLDGDDVLLPGFLEGAFKIISENPGIAIIGGHDIRITSAGPLQFDPSALPNGEIRAVPRILRGADAFRFIIEWMPNPCSSGTIYRSDAFHEIGGYDPDLVWGEDWEIWLRLAARWPVAYVDSPSALYRIHERSRTAAARIDRTCYGYDAVYSRAAQLCTTSELRPLLRKKFFRTARIYVGAARRTFRQQRSVAGAFERLVCASRAVTKALVV